MSLLLEIILIPVVFLVVGSTIVFGMLNIIARLFLLEPRSYDPNEDNDFISPFNMFQDFNKIDRDND